MTIIGWTVPAGAASPGVEVNTCGQVFSGGGFLSGDLDCSAFVGDAVTIQGGTLDLRGFTLTATAPFRTVLCEKSCKVLSDPPGGMLTSDGSGTIAAVSGSTSIVGPRVDLRVSGVLINDGQVSTNFVGNIKVIDSTITGVVSNIVAAVDALGGTVRLLRSVVTGNAGIGVDSKKAKIIDSEVSNNGEIGVFGRTSVRIKRSTISGNGFDGVTTNNKSVRVSDSSVTGNGIAGISLPGFSSKAKILRSDISGNAAQGIAGFPARVIVRESTITNNGAEGIRQAIFGVTKLTDSTITANALDGVLQASMNGGCQLKLRGMTTVAGNGNDPSCGVSRTCADLTSCGFDPPEVDSTSMCDTSYDVNSGFPGVSWGVCALD